MDDWLVSVEKDGKVVELYYSKNLINFGTIKAIHSDCNIVATRLDNIHGNIEKIETNEVKTVTRKVKCLETGEIFSSVTECADIINVSRWNVYKAIQRGTVLCNRHYDYVI